MIDNYKIYPIVHTKLHTLSQKMGYRTVIVNPRADIDYKKYNILPEKLEDYDIKYHREAIDWWYVNLTLENIDCYDLKGIILLCNAIWKKLKEVEK